MSRRSSHNWRAARKELAFSQLRWVDLAVPPERLADVRRLVTSLLKRRYPFLSQDDAYRNFLSGRINGVMMHPFHVHPDDIDYLRQQVASIAV